MKQPNVVFIGIKGHVLALDRATGTELWSTVLKGVDFVNVAWLEGELFATTKGELFALDPATGHIRWNNRLTGLGRGLVTIAVPGGQAVLSQEKRRRDEQAAAAAAVAAAAAGRLT